MNAPASLSRLRRAAPASANDLRAWPLIRTLVGFDTTSRDSNLALIEWVRDYLAQHGVESHLTFDDGARKANLFATLPARDGETLKGGVVLSGHTDVVPVDGQPWDTPPFEATAIDDRIHGRGTADMKGFIATALVFVPEWCSQPLARPVHFALSYDEEVGCIGVRRLIADVAARGLSPTGCIIGEPTGMELVIAHKGKHSFRCRVRGHEAHSSLTPHGVNAVQIACEIVTYLTGIARGFRDEGRFDGAYDVPFTTVHTGVIHGGTALNIVPRDCWFDFEVRHLPFDDPQDILDEVKAYAERFLPEMHAVDPHTGIEFEQLSRSPGMDVDHDNAIVTIAKCCSGSSTTGKVSYSTEAGLFHDASMPAVICGPGHIAQAHQPNEWISLEQLGHCETFMQRLTDELVTPR
jgi:acetylornithine deacetylase